MSKWFNMNRKERTVESDILKPDSIDVEAMNNKNESNILRKWDKLNTQEKIFVKSNIQNALLFGPR